MMGGTDLFVRMREGMVRPKTVVDLKHLPGMRKITYDQSDGLYVGAAVTMNEIACHPDVSSHYPLLREAAKSVASYQLRNRATIGGNLCNASPCADTAPAVMVLDGSFAIFGPDGEQSVRASDFATGPGETVLKLGEFVTAVHLPVPPNGSVGTYIKLSRSKLGDLAIVSVAILCYPDTVAGSGYRFRIALGSVAPVVLRAPKAEDLLCTEPVNEETFALAAEKAMETASPIDDVRGGAVYRSEMVRNLTLRGLRTVWSRMA
jgi:carbon-monoxide dehydrogenase medium subunit